MALRIFLATLVITMSTTVFSHSATGATPEERAKALVAEHESRIRPLEIRSGKAWWTANVSGKDEDFAAKEAAQNSLDAALADAKRFEELKSLDDATFSDPLLDRTIHVLFLSAQEKQVDVELLRKISAKANAVEKQFNAFRAEVDGKSLTDSDVRAILKTSGDAALRKKAWEASKRVGALVEVDLKELVALRNQAAKALGFANFHAMQLTLNEQATEDVIRLFDDLDLLTRGPFLEIKAEIDAKLAERAGIKIADLRPWHYHDPFFQETPAVFDADLDAPYKQADLLRLCRDFYEGIGLPIDDVIARSDLYEKPGKSPHAFCIDVDRAGDVRVLANIVPNEYWMGTMLHELGHAVYSSKNIPERLPYALRTEAHILATEGVAMLFERFSKDADWLQAMGVKLNNAEAFDQAGGLARRARLLIFSRWCQVMLRFEKALYENPERDLNDLWWDLVEEYQGLNRPEDRGTPDYASKIHIVSAPAYYHNYMMGELFASQVHAALCREALGDADPRNASYVGRKAVGDFMRARVFAPGRTLSWNELTRHATGESLNPKAFAAEFRSR